MSVRLAGQIRITCVNGGGLSGAQCAERGLSYCPDRDRGDGGPQDWGVFLKRVSTSAVVGWLPGLRHLRLGLVVPTPPAVTFVWHGPRARANFKCAPCRRSDQAARNVCTVQCGAGEMLAVMTGAKVSSGLTLSQGICAGSADNSSVTCNAGSGGVGLPERWCLGPALLVRGSLLRNSIVLPYTS